ncbi:hypothetical protein [Salinibaculum rarum]|uniref:hypothetical protein n=1 Tax=Salinibaculum rarum TaxID=3058903 RepID=UPI00265EC096|nr:hypothetical protein [Salinibaculum sp. KK48]
MVQRWQSVVLLAVGLVLLGTGIGATLVDPASDDYQVAIEEERSVYEFGSFSPTEQETLLTVFNRTQCNGTTTVPRAQLPPAFRSVQQVVGDKPGTPKPVTATTTGYGLLEQAEFVLNYDGTLQSITTTPQPDTRNETVTIRNISTTVSPGVQYLLASEELSDSAREVVTTALASHQQEVTVSGEAPAEFQPPGDTPARLGHGEYLVVRNETLYRLTISGGGSFGAALAAVYLRVLSFALWSFGFVLTAVGITGLARSDRQQAVALTGLTGLAGPYLVGLYYDAFWLPLGFALLAGLAVYAGAHAGRDWVVALAAVIVFVVAAFGTFSPNAALLRMGAVPLVALVVYAGVSRLGLG